MQLCTTLDVCRSHQPITVPASLVVLHIGKRSYFMCSLSLPELDISAMSLNALRLGNFDEIVGLPDTIGDLPSLVTLSVHSCKRLTSLPDSVGNLKVLASIDLTACENLQRLPDTIGNL